MKRPSFLAIAGALLAASCALQDSSEVQIKNASGEPITDIKIQIGGRQLRVASIDAGSEARIAFEPVSDSSIRTTYSVSRTTYICEGDIYVTTGTTHDVVVEVQPSGKCLASEVK